MIIGSFSSLPFVGGKKAIMMTTDMLAFNSVDNT